MFSHRKSDGEGGTLVVESILANGAASRMHDQIRPGDILAKVDGISAENMSPHELGALILGPEGSTVKIEFDRVQPVEWSAGLEEADHVARPTRVVCHLVRSQVNNQQNHRQEKLSSSASSPGSQGPKPTSSGDSVPALRAVARVGGGLQYFC